MSIIRIQLDPPPPDGEYERLKSILCDVMRGGKLEGEPQIKVHIRKVGPYPGADILVRWDEFSLIDYALRDRMIRECWREVKSEDDPDDKTVMGFTSEQAARIGISFESEEAP